MGADPQPFLHLADGFIFPRLGEIVEVKIYAVDSADVSFDQYYQSYSVKPTGGKNMYYYSFPLTLNSCDGPVSLMSLVFYIKVLYCLGLVLSRDIYRT